MARTILEFMYNRNHGVKMTPLEVSFLTGDKNGHEFRIAVVDEEGPVSLTGSTVKAWLIADDQNRPDDESVELTGNVEENVACVTLSEACYLKVGRFTLTIKVGAGNDLATIFWGQGNMVRTHTGVLNSDGSSAPILQSKAVTPSETAQTVTPDSGYDGLSAVYLKGDSDLVASNIKSGVEIFGVTGTYTGESSGGDSLPTGISALASGVYTPDSDVTQYVSIPHNLGVKPNFVALTLMDTLSDAIPNMLISFSEVKKAGLPAEMGRGYCIYYNSTGTLTMTGMQDSMTDENDILVYATSARALKAGYSYRWVCGVMDGIA